MEVDEDSSILWQWRSIDHIEEFGLSESAKNSMYRASTLPVDYDGLHSTMHSKDPNDYLHCNSVSYLGPNRWYDGGDQRFHPENIIWDSRDTNIIAIIGRESGELTWKLGPDYTGAECREFGQIIGQHHAHIIPRGLPGEGNLLVFDNGGFAGYGDPNPGAPIGQYNAVRPYSRVLEIDPVTLELKWEYSARTAGHMYHHHYVFYSPYVSSAQRLPNGNTLICEVIAGASSKLHPITRLFGSMFCHQAFRRTTRIGPTEFPTTGCRSSTNRRSYRLNLRIRPRSILIHRADALVSMIRTNLQ